MNIAVCVKQVPDPEQFDKISLNKETHTINRTGIPTVMNPLDKHALEEALTIKENYGGKVTAISMGPPQARDALEEALAMGVDEGVLLCDRSFAGADTWATAYCLAQGIKKTGPFDLILCGNQTSDGATGQVAPQLAFLLNVPHVTFVEKIDFSGDPGAPVVRQQLEYGFMRLQVKLPVVLAVLKDINQYRLPNILAIMEAAGKPIHVWDAAEIDADIQRLGLPGSPTRVHGIAEQKVSRRKHILTGEPEQAAQEAVRKLLAWGVIS
jgi:electron transfer flavoprotein beta subunit